MQRKQKRYALRFPDYSRDTTISWVMLATSTLIFCTILSLITSSCGGALSSHFSKPHAKMEAFQATQVANSSSVSVAAHSPQSSATATTTSSFTTSHNQLINVPYFATAVPFNQTAIFWFGDVTSTDTYTDVRVGYNNSELYIDLRIVDHYLWYDPNTSAPDITRGDNATIYLNSTTNGSSQPDQHSYKFQAAVNGNIVRNNYQQAYVGNGMAWTAANMPFTALYGWRGQGFNGPQDSGWSMTYHIPFTSLGLSGSPSQGVFWKLAVKVHNQDDAANTPLPDKWWPVSSSELVPSSWGQIRFGLPTYLLPHTSTTTSYTIRNMLNNQVVIDGMVGGALGCGHSGLNRWTQVGVQSYPAATQINIQNESDISDWNCFSKFYITFPLSSLPTGQSVVNAKVTLYEYGNAGAQGQPNPSYIQVATVNQNWNPATLSWNTAPLVQENITSMLVNTKTQPVVPQPGVPITWDISRAVAQAYATGQPLRLVFYSTDNQYNTGKYFWASSAANWNASGRPTLNVTLGS